MIFNIVALDEDNYYEEYVYIEAYEKEYGRFLSIGDKCGCIEPRYAREYIKNKVEAMTIYNYNIN